MLTSEKSEPSAKQAALNGDELAARPERPLSTSSPVVSEKLTAWLQVVGAFFIFFNGW